MKKNTSKQITLALALIILGQIVFAIVSTRFTVPRYEGRIYATTAVEHRNEDLHKLNEAAHYFGQTMIGWLKFPNFMNQLNETVSLPDGSGISAHIQERQNIIFVVSSPSELSQKALEEVKDFIQSKMDEYNSVSQTKFVLSNLDYEQVKIQKSYAYGAFISLIISIVLAGAILFVRKELF